MSYCRFGWGPNNEFPGTPEAEAAGASDLYLIGTSRIYDPETGKETHGIECCGCILTPVGFPFFTELPKILAHLDEHRKAGHTVHPWVQPDIEADFQDGIYSPPWIAGKLGRT